MIAPQDCMETARNVGTCCLDAKGERQAEDVGQPEREEPASNQGAAAGTAEMAAISDLAAGAASVR
jgi:hypothetical protein